MPNDTSLADSVFTGASDYDRFASVYDEWLAEDFCRRAFPVVERLLLTNVPPNSRILDLCCGTGRIARELNRRGYSITGVDASSEMIRIARGNVPGCDFLCCDAQEISFRAEFDGAVSAFNSLAHLDTIADLKRVFCNVRKALRTGSPFLFDLSMEEAYTSKWRGSFAVANDDHACIVRPTYDPASRIGTNHITLFQLNSAKWHRSDFDIRQRCHTIDDLRSALIAAGYDNVQTYDAERDLGIEGESGQTFFLCR